MVLLKGKAEGQQPRKTGGMELCAEGGDQQDWQTGRALCHRVGVSIHLAVSSLSVSVTGPRIDLVCVRRYAPELVRGIVKDVLERLGRPALHVADMPVDVEWQVARIKQQLADLSASGSAVMGLYGMGGVGKTTLVKRVFNKLQLGYIDTTCFVEVGKHAGELQLQQAQRQMLKDLCGIDREVSSVDAGRAELSSRLSSARVLLVIDNIWRADQLRALLVKAGQGSCILVTTCDVALLHGASNILRWPVTALSERAALELFCWHAFLQKQPPSGYSSLAARAAQACSGLPLALTVMGTHLWNALEKEAWEEAVLRLQKAKPFGGGKKADDILWGQLLLSYDSLDDDEQQLFLDIACSMLGKDAQQCLPVWGRLARSTLEILKNKSLISVTSHGDLAMHDQLRDLGRAIVTGEHRRTGHRSRIWMPEAHEVVRRKQASLCPGQDLVAWW